MVSPYEDGGIAALSEQRKRRLPGRTSVIGAVIGASIGPTHKSESSNFQATWR